MVDKYLFGMRKGVVVSMQDLRGLASENQLPIAKVTSEIVRGAGKGNILAGEEGITCQQKKNNELAHGRKILPRCDSDAPHLDQLSACPHHGPFAKRVAHVLIESHKIVRHGFT